MKNSDIRCEMARIREYNKSSPIIIIQQANIIIDKPIVKKTKHKSKMRIWHRDEYHEYIVSDDWHRKAKKLKKKVGYICQSCFKHQPYLHVHHVNYDHIGDERPDDLLVLCGTCHKGLHELEWHDRVSSSCAIRENWKRYINARK